MKFFFLKTDSLYKIFKTLEKIPSQKAVQIFIDPEHPFFENQWRGKQVAELINTRHLNVTFLSENGANRQYFQQLGLNVQYEEEKPIVKFFKAVSLFFFDIKRFHLHTYSNQKYLFYLIFSLEILAGIGVLWFLVVLVLPTANITIKVAQQTEDIIYNFRYYPIEERDLMGGVKQISIPYYTGSVDYDYQLSISTENLQHITNPSAGYVKVYNRTSNELKLLGNTRFVTSDGLVFLAKDPITIPAGLKDSPSELRVKLYAAELDENGLIMGIRGNIPKDTRLMIRNIKDSYYLGQIWAETIEPFTGGSSTSLGIISEKDKEILMEKIKSGVYADKINIVSKLFKQKGSLLFSFDPFIKTTFHYPFSIDGKIGEKATFLKGGAKVSFDFLYLHWDDIVEAFSSYVLDRQSDSIELISINPNSLVFIDNIQTIAGTNGKMFMAPTKVTIYQGYDFSRDVKNILQTIKSKTAGMTIEEARKFILQYPEISSVKIKLGFLQGDLLPNVKSRIKVKVEY